MVDTPKYLLVQERLSDSLVDVLRTWRQAGVPYQAMARLLQAQTNVSLTGQTIRDWFYKIDAA